MIQITLPDNSVRTFEGPVNGMEIARSLSNSLAREVLSITVNGEVWDLMRTINTDASVKLNTWDDQIGRASCRERV